MIQGRSKIEKNGFKLLNIYGPYINRRDYWENLRQQAFWKDDSLIVGGDLNFILSNRERWGFNSRPYYLSSYFSYILEEAELVDIEPIPIKPTFSNKRVGEAGIAKRLDRFLVT